MDSPARMACHRGPPPGTETGLGLTGTIRIRGDPEDGPSSARAGTALLPNPPPIQIVQILDIHRR